MLEALLITIGGVNVPLGLILGAVLVVVGLLVIRFVIKTALTIMKIAILAGIGIAIWLGLDYLIPLIS